MRVLNKIINFDLQQKAQTLMESTLDQGLSCNRILSMMKSDLYIILIPIYN